MSDADGTAAGVVSPGPPDDLGQRRREQKGWCWYDWANSVFPTSIISVFMSLYLTTVAEDAAKAAGQPCPTDNALTRCDIHALGLTFPAGALWGYLLSIATILLVPVLPLVGAIGDHTRNRRGIMGGCAFAGALTTALMVLVAGTNWQLGVVLFIVANTFWYSSVVVYYAMLPEIATADERDDVSSRGWAFGYLGSGLALAIQLVIFLLHERLGLSTSAAVRLCLLITGIWWGLFTLVPLSRLGRHKAPPDRTRGVAALGAGLRQLGNTVKSARAFPLTLAFLGSYLIYTDGVSTVANVAGQYGNRELGLDQQTLIATILLVQFVAYFGGVLHGFVARRLGARRTIMFSLVGWMLLVGLAYFVPAHSPVPFFALAVGIGLVLGGTNALSRSLYSQMVPRGREGEYFSLYLIGEEATSWLGPLVFAGVGQATGSFRPAIVALAAFFVVGLVLVSRVPVRKAIRAAGNPEPNLV